MEVIIEDEGWRGSVWVVNSGERDGWEVEDKRVRSGGWRVSYRMTRLFGFDPCTHLDSI